MMKHTSAPWISEAHCSGKSPDAGCGVIASDDELVISNPSRGIVAWATRHVGQTSAEVEANARLISTAPDYHEVALELDRLRLVIESAVRNADLPHHQEVVELLRSNMRAIGKASGEKRL